MKQLTLEYIEDLATGPSLIRGRSYYFEDAVRKVVRRGNVYEARVQGTRLYSVTVVESDQDYLFYCNCPYDFGGICKHCVAVGMAIVEGDYKIGEKSSQVEDKRPEIPTEQFFTEIYGPADVAKKNDFLKMLLEKDGELRSQFLSFVNETGDTESSLSIDEIRDEVYKTFSEFDFSDMDYDLYYSTRPQYGYVEEWEIHYDLAKEMIEGVFDDYASQATGYIKKGNLIDGVKVVLGVYEGCYNVYLPGNDPYCIFEDGYNDELMKQVKSVIDKVTETINGTIKTTTAVKRSLELLIQRYHHYDQIDYSDDEDEIGYNLNMFRDLMLALLTNEDVAHFLDRLFDEYDVDRPHTAFVRIRIAEVLGNDKRWLEEAERFSESEPEIARRLMDTYLENQKRNDFYRIGRKAFRNWPDEFDEYLVKNISKAEQKKLYIKVLTHLTERKKDIERYKELRVLLSEYIKDRFIENNTLNRIFYVKMLDVEERFDEILDYVKKHKNSYDFVHLIRPILNVYSKECFSLIQQKTDETLKDQRGRRVYQEVVGWLLEMKKINATQSKTQHYFQEIWDRRPILPALRDEMRKARLI